VAKAGREVSRAVARPRVVIEPGEDWWAVDLRELYDRRDLILYMTWRAIRPRYAQSALGIGWAVIQPLSMLAIYSVIFSRVAKISVPGGLPYALVAFCGIVPWTFFSGALTGGSNSLISNNAMLRKIYVPRLILPLSQVLSKAVDLTISLVLLGIVMIGFAAAGYDFSPRAEAFLVIPAAVGLALAAALGFSLWLSAMAVQYRDVSHALTFGVQLAMYLTPVIYTTEMIPDRLRPIFGLNPMVAVISCFRASLLGPPFQYHPGLILEGTLVAAALLVGGVLYFRRAERIFADVA
jgi:lipopolysaccharide transport system permease protein